MSNGQVKCKICYSDLSELPTDNQIKHFNECIVKDDIVDDELNSSPSSSQFSKYFQNHLNVDAPQQCSVFTQIKPVAEENREIKSSHSLHVCPFCKRTKPMTIIHIKQCASKKGVPPKRVLEILKKKKETKLVSSTASLETKTVQKKEVVPRKKPKVKEKQVKQTVLDDTFKNNTKSPIILSMSWATKNNKKAGQSKRKFELEVCTEEERRRLFETRFSLMICNIVDNRSTFKIEESLPLHWRLASLPQDLKDHVVVGFEKYVCAESTSAPTQ